MVTGYKNGILERSFHRAPPSGLVSDFRIGEHYRTTTGSYHGQKVQKPSHTNILYKKAPGHWNVNYMEVNLTKNSSQFLLILKSLRPVLTLS